MPIRKNTMVSGTRKFVQNVGRVTEKTLNEIIIIGSQYAAAITPIDTSTLINSQYREVYQKADGKWQGVVGYTAGYALYVHNASGKLKGQPRSSVESFTTTSGKVAFASDKGNFWDPDAEPKFLVKGFERDGAAEIRALILRNYQAKNVVK